MWNTDLEFLFRTDAVTASGTFGEFFIGSEKGNEAATTAMATAVELQIIIQYAAILTLSNDQVSEFIYCIHSCSINCFTAVGQSTVLSCPVLFSRR